MPRGFDQTPDDGIIRKDGEKMADFHYRKSELKRTRFLDYIKQGYNRKEARLMIPWSEKSVLYNIKKYPQFAANVQYEEQKFKDLPERLASGEDLSFARFVQLYFPDREDHLPQQLEIVDNLEDLGPREIRMFLIWPEAGKTATLEDYICRKLAFDPGHRFRYVSEAQDLAKRVVGTCQRRFTDDKYAEFIKKYGPFYEKNQERTGRPWTQNEFTLKKNKSGERDRNLVASSWTSAVYGSRIDTLILDDLQSQRNYVQAEEIFKRIRGTFFNRGIGIRTLIIGTRIGPGDFYERMLDAGLVTTLVERRAADPVTGEPTVPQFWDRIEMHHDGGVCCKGFRTCPRDNSRLTAREYMEVIKHQSGSETWFASYQQNPQANELSTFAEWIDHCLDHDRTIGQRHVA